MQGRRFAAPAAPDGEVFLTGIAFFLQRRCFSDKKGVDYRM
jgi:hypothetical protein